MGAHPFTRLLAGKGGKECLAFLGESLRFSVRCKFLIGWTAYCERIMAGEVEANAIAARPGLE